MYFRTKYAWSILLAKKLLNLYRLQAETKINDV